jgi:hypothetical protein
VGTVGFGGQYGVGVVNPAIREATTEHIFLRQPIFEIADLAELASTVDWS